MKYKYKFFLLWTGLFITRKRISPAVRGNERYKYRRRRLESVTKIPCGLAAVIFIFSLLLAHLATSYNTWAGDLPQWGDFDASLSYDVWLKIYSQAWGENASLGINQLNFPETHGQIPHMASFSDPSTRIWLEALSFGQ